MNKKLSGLVFVLIIAGCHTSQEGAVCPAPEETASEPEMTTDVDKPVQRTPEEEELLKDARRYLRETRHRTP